MLPIWWRVYFYQIYGQRCQLLRFERRRQMRCKTKKKKQIEEEEEAFVSPFLFVSVSLNFVAPAHRLAATEPIIAFPV